VEDENIYRGVQCELLVCFFVSSNATLVCSGHGACIGPNFCNCSLQWGHVVQDPTCSQPLCEGILSNDARVCSKHGICADNHVCNCDFAFSGAACGEFDALGFSLVNNWYLWYLILPFVVFLFCVASFVVIVAIVRLIIKQRKKIKKFDILDDIELLIEEQKINKDQSIAHLKISMTLFEVNYKDIQLLKAIGSGGSGSSVYLCKWNEKLCAFKCFKTTTVCSSQLVFDEFEKEVNILGSIAHPNIIKFYGASIHPPRIGYLMEYCEKGDLVCFFRCNNPGLSWVEKIRILKEVAIAQNFLHSKKIIHR